MTETSGATAIRSLTTIPPAVPERQKATGFQLARAANWAWLMRTPFRTRAARRGERREGEAR
jgi:hypothetical protein